MNGEAGSKVEKKKREVCFLRLSIVSYFMVLVEFVSN